MTARVSYDSSSEDDSETHSLSADNCSEIISKSCKRDIDVESTGTKDVKRQKLFVPDAVKSMFKEKSFTEHHQDDPSLHAGRMRTFAHERGNWASYVYFPITDHDKMKELTESLMDLLNPVADFNIMEDFHVSLSKTFILRHHWIEPLFETLKTKLKLCERCLCDMSGIEFYCNDEQTRTFLGLKIAAGCDSLKKYVKEIDTALKEFKLPEYYKEPSFHISIGWAHGNVCDNITAKLKQELELEVTEYMDIYPRLSVINVDNLCLKTGNKFYNIPLS